MRLFGSHTRGIIGALRVGRFTILLPAASWTSSCCILTWFSIHGLAESLRSYTHARTYTYTHMLGMVENFSSRPEMDRSGRKVSTFPKKLSRSSLVALACASTRADTHAYTDLRIRFHLGDTLRAGVRGVRNKQPLRKTRRLPTHPSHPSDVGRKLFVPA